MLPALIRLASWIVPAARRPAWYAQWAARARDWQWLADRGEPVGGAWPLFRRALTDATVERRGPIRVRTLLRSPIFVPIAMAVVLLLLAGVSRGFAVTRAVLAIAHDLRAHPAYCGVYDARGDRIFVYLAPVVLAWAVGVALLAAGCRWLRGPGWRYWSLLALKAAAGLVLVTLVWIEVGTLLRGPIHREGWRTLVGLSTVLVYVAATGRAMLWTIEDQRQRCRTCLRRLVAPVTVGSWASSFDPPATESLCENGHGALAVSDRETNGQDRWTRLDESWQTLFG